jgi:hypothetical protein
MKNQPIDREQVILWAMDAGFNPGFVRMNIRYFEAFANLIRLYVEDRNDTRNSND